VEPRLPALISACYLESIVAKRDMWWKRILPELLNGTLQSWEYRWFGGHSCKT